MKDFIFRSATGLSFGNFWIKYTKNPYFAENLGGVVMCRSSFIVHPIPNYIPNLSAPYFKNISNKILLPLLPPRSKEVPPHPTSHLS